MRPTLSPLMPPNSIGRLCRSTSTARCNCVVSGAKRSSGSLRTSREFGTRIGDFGSTRSPSIVPDAESCSVTTTHHRPNHALQRTEAGRCVSSVFFALRGQPLSLSLSSLGDTARHPWNRSKAQPTTPTRWQIGRLLLRAAWASFWLPPTMRSHAVTELALAACALLFLMALPSRVPPPLQSSTVAIQFLRVRWLSWSAPSRCHLVVSAVFSRVSPVSPNHALQRTEARRQVFPAFHVLRGQPLSLSLEALGDYALFPC